MDSPSRLSAVVVLLTLGLAQCGFAEDRSASGGIADAGSPPNGAGPETEAVRVAPLGKATKPSVAPLGKPGKPKFALKTTAGGGAGGEAKDRGAELKRLVDAYHGVAIGYVNRLAHAATPAEKQVVREREPSAASLRPFVRLIAEIPAVDPKDEPALDALLFLNQFVGIPIIDETLAATVCHDGKQGIDPRALILEHHADSPKLAAALWTWPESSATDQSLIALFNQTHSPQVRGAAGIRLVGSLQRSGRLDVAERLAEAMASDRYLEGAPISSKPDSPSARAWAEGKLREFRLVSVGKELPEVTGEKLSGGVGRSTDYRGKVVVLDVWTTWCGPCVAMIPHQQKMAEQFRDAPFALLSVSCDAERETLEGFLESKPMPWDHWWVGADSELQKSLNISAFPTVIVLDADGVIRHKNIKGEELEEAVETLIEEAKNAG